MEEQPSFETPQLSTEHEQQVVTAAEAEQPRYKTLGVRLDEGLHAQLSFIAQLTGNTLADEIRSAIEGRVLAAQGDQELVAKADAVRREIEREAAARRQAIAGFFGSVSLEHSANQEDAQPRTAQVESAASEPSAGETTRRKRPTISQRNGTE